MGTNFYRIVTEEEIEHRKARLIDRINDMVLSPHNIESGFVYIEDSKSPWDEFLNDVSVHLGKRSSGWKFTWNFHNNRYYSNKEELFKFIRSGRVVDEYGDLINNEDFIKMAINWCQPHGRVFDEDYVREYEKNSPYGPEYYNKTIDGLNVSAHTDFC